MLLITAVCIVEKVAKDGIKILPAYVPLLQKYSLHLLELCEDSEKMSVNLTSSWLKKYMFKDDKNVNERVKKAVNYLSNYNEHLMHSRPLSIKKLSRLELKITSADDKLQDLLWEAYILINGLFSISSIIKLYENTKGVFKTKSK